MTIFPSESRMPVYGKRLIKDIEECVDERTLMMAMIHIKELLEMLEAVAERQHITTEALLFWYMNYVTSVEGERNVKVMHDD